MLNSAFHSAPVTIVPPSAVEITPAHHDDLPLVQSLAHEIWHRHYPGIISAAQIDYMLERGYSIPALASFVDAADRGLDVARRDGRALGFAAWYRTDMATEMKLDKLYVLPQCHGEGIGRALIDRVAETARGIGCASLVLNVNRNNLGAIKAYESCGFVIRTAGDFPIGSGFVMEDYIMARAL